MSVTFQVWDYMSGGWLLVSKYHEPNKDVPLLPGNVVYVREGTIHTRAFEILRIEHFINQPSAPEKGFYTEEEVVINSARTSIDTTVYLKRTVDVQHSAFLSPEHRKDTERDRQWIEANPDDVPNW